MSTKLDTRLSRLEAQAAARVPAHESQAEALLSAWHTATFAIMAYDELADLGLAVNAAVDHGVPVPPQIQAMWDGYAHSPTVAGQRTAYLKHIGQWHETTD